MKQKHCEAQVTARCHGNLISLLWVLLLTPLLFLSPASATQVDGLFSAEVPVYDRSVEQRRVGIKQAFEKVLIKVSGNRNVVFVPDLVPAENKVEQFVEQFVYRDIDLKQQASSHASPSDTTGEEATILPRNEPVDDAPQEPPPTLMLRVGFDANAILRRLQQANLPVWDATRPLTLIWLVVQEGGERFMFEPELHQEIKQSIEQVSAERGLPVVLPLMDLDDRTSLTTTDVWGDFNDMITNASQRYGADAVAVVRLSSEDGQFWQGRWSLYESDEANRWENQGEAQLSTLSDGLNAVADALARRYAQVLSPNLEPPLTLTLLDIHQFEHYAKAMNYLEGLTQIANLRVSRIANNKVELHLTIRGSREGLEDVIRLGGVLDKVLPLTQEVAVTIQGAVDDVPDPKLQQGLVYRLLP